MTTERLFDGDADYFSLLRNLGLDKTMLPETSNFVAVHMLRRLADDKKLSNREMLAKLKESFPGFNYVVVSDKIGKKYFAAFACQKDQPTT